MWRTLLLLRRLCIGAVLVATPAAAQPNADALFAAIGAKEGATLCEIGAGDGALAIAAARVVGPAGRVYANELGDARTDKLRAAVTASGLTQITVLAGSSGSTNFPDAACDAVFMRDVYHHFTDPPATTAAIGRALKAAGRVAIVDFTPPPGSRAPTPADRANDGMHGIHPEEMTAEMKAAGFHVAGSEIGHRWFMLVFQRATP